jgi:hypothetical protein
VFGATGTVMPALRRRARRVLAFVLLGGLVHATGLAGLADGGSTSLGDGYCDPGRPLTAAQRDTVLRFGAAVKAELERSGARLALISRTGVDLGRFALRYSHAGIALRASPESPWAVRQLYYACDERMPRLFDQGLSAFLLGDGNAELGYVSIVFLPEPAAATLERHALDNRAALELLGARYSANAYPFSVRYQNCNQWLIELLASAWGPGVEGEPGADGDPATRVRAQRWLRARDYQPTSFDVGWLLATWAGAFVPWVRRDDHPPQDLARHVYRVSMPASIEAFVRTQFPEATRVELCHDGRQVVARRGWQALADDCRPGAQDEVRPLP